ncbi:hypothetical protein FQN54_000512 [Arachnomyces sp. PD_36]|nr:hypothetical protein FQN54_000512 [Arachnomyces sp. PD_36]
MAPSFSQIQDDASVNRIFIIGGGIVGAALAFYLSGSNVDKQIVVLDKSLGSLSGSTGYAPGFVGQFNTSTALTTLAKDTVKEYLSIPGGFDSVGGLELSSTLTGAENLEQRCSLAKEAGLPAEILSPEKAAALAPDFVKTESVTSALHFPTDGTANATIITNYFRQKAQDRGAVFLETNITSLKAERAGSITAISTTQGQLQTGSNPVILCTGIWTQSLLQSASIATKTPIPIIPVAHPYTYTPSRPRRSGPAYPFVRWPEHTVYARDHGDCDGLGSYNHAPSKVANLPNSAVGDWPTEFESVLGEACRTCLKNGDQFLTTNQGDSEVTDKRRPFNGIFSMTPDNLPLAGKVEDVQNLWVCAAVWVTHAAGTAKLIARQILLEHGGGGDGGEEEDGVLLEALDPNRFKGGDLEVLTREAVGKYNDIYNKEEA